MREQEVCYYSVTDAQSAKIRCHEDIGDIRKITEGGRLTSVKRLGRGTVEITEIVDGIFRKREEVHTLYNAFVTQEEAQEYATEVIQQEIQQLVHKLKAIKK